MEPLPMTAAIRPDQRERLLNQVSRLAVQGIHQIKRQIELDDWVGLETSAFHLKSIANDLAEVASHLQDKSASDNTDVVN
jgi:hypothetical protein